MTEYRLENWCTRVSNPYQAPELQSLCLHGEVYNHPSYNEGEPIGTSNIVKVDGNRITTKSGSVYVLGEPAKEFVEYCKEIGCHVPTKETPIKEHTDDN